jgi:hypothetical protein
MKRSILLFYQWGIGISDTATGALLILAPDLTLRLMNLHVPTDTLPYLSFIGAFVFAVGLSCIYGALLMIGKGTRSRLETVWMLTAFSRASVAVFVLTQILQHTLEAGWLTVAITDAACVLIQAIGLRKGWLAHGQR